MSQARKGVSKAAQRRTRARARIYRLAAQGFTPTQIAADPSVPYTAQWVGKLLAQAKPGPKRRKARHALVPPAPVGQP